MNMPTIREGGERLYAHPFSVSHRCATVHYLDGNEQTPYDNDYIIGVDKSPLFTNMPLVRRLWYAVVKRLAVAAARAYRHGYPVALLDVMFTTAVPFVADDFPNITLHLDYQLGISDPARRAADVYIVPSQQWIAERVEAMLGTRNQYEHIEEDKEAFRLWRAGELAKGREIRYLVSIDT